MAVPIVSDWSRLKRVARYLVGRPRLVMKYEYQGAISELDIYSDSNWVGCRVTRKSTSGGCICLGSHCIKSWSNTQHNITTNSAEAEAVAVVKATSESMVVSRMCPEFGRILNKCVYVDVSAAIWDTREGRSRKIRHVDVGVLWMLQKYLRQKQY